MVLGPDEILSVQGLREVRQPLNLSGGHWRGKLSCDDPLANDESRRAASSLQSVPSYSLSVIIGHILSAANLATAALTRSSVTLHRPLQLARVSSP